jgi:hypothetical protein
VFLDWIYPSVVYGYRMRNKIPEDENWHDFLLDIIEGLYNYADVTCESAYKNGDCDKGWHNDQAKAIKNAEQALLFAGRDLVINIDRFEK